MSTPRARGDAAGPMRNQTRLRDVIVRRPRVGTVTGLLLALVFALIVTPVVLAESWAVDPRVAPGEIAPVTVRVGADDVGSMTGVRRTGGVIIARGERATDTQAQAVAAVARQAPRGWPGFAAYGLVLFALAAGFTHHLKRSNRGRLLRVQLVLLGTIALGAAVTKGLLLAYPLSVLAVPVALGAIVPTLVHDREVGLATGVLAAVVMSLLVPFDVGVLTVLIVQAVSTAIVIPERPRPRWSLALAAGMVSLAGAALTYMAFAYLSSRALPFEELATPAASSFVAASVGGVMAALLAMPLLPLYERACGEITHRRLVSLEDLSHPLLRQIAEKAPGTWQHSLAMANLAEVAAHAIGASGRLVRVGAYFHDLGKSLQPTYFIENLAPGEPSPHDQLAPEVSCDAIFSHVTEGILLARRHKLPERIIDFMHMHHGDGVLEYFWAKCQEQGNPRHLTVNDFRYPGVPPQSRETAILAVCDAVEAASRTLKRPDARSVENLVQRIVYGKLHLGQLDESGLSMADLRRMSDSLREAIRHAYHDRIEYPWQREAAAEAAAASTATADTVGAKKPVAARVGIATQQLMNEPRLDSLDVPRPIQWDDRGREAGLVAGAVITPAPGAVEAPVASGLTSGEATPPARPAAVAATNAATTAGTTAAASASTSGSRKATEPAAFGDTLDLAIATTAGLTAAPATPATPATATRPATATASEAAAAPASVPAAP
ncbi:MAG TPA: HDIG domain-containing protein, partial [Kofleriaceae bacterium]|nr:HDIG domain-containing protein [Kofleriaceae bacterium]